MSDNILIASNITCGYGEKVILSGVDFALSKGECVGIIGPNGSGKTTLLRVLTRVIPLKGGRVELYGTDINMISVRDIARKVAFVSQGEGSLFSHTTVEQMVTLGRFPHFSRFQWFVNSVDQEKIETAMRIVDVSHLRGQYIGCLSGGERQRVFIARALAQEPDVLLLDEPTMHLDIGHSIDVFNKIAMLVKERKISVVCVLHDLNMASVFCKRLFILSEGSIAFSGTPEEVIRAEYIEKIYSVPVKVYKGELSKKPQVLY